ncbi:MAG: hypothetical protein ACOH2N_08105 [Devosia sp.]
MPRPKNPRKPKSPKILPLLLLLLAATPALAAQTATVSGTPKLYDGPGTEFDATGKTLPAGALVTLERCSSDLAGAALPGLVLPAPGAGDWCLVRGAGWVEAGALVNLSGDPASLFTDKGPFDPLKEAAPSWDDLGDPDE